jgi:enamine deaminase RidA (YjgF/YER057c/UK114 family)
VPIESRLNEVSANAAPNGFAHAIVTTGRTAHVSGQVALGADGQLVGPDDLRAQTEQCMRNLENILTELGATWHDVARFGWYLLADGDVQVVRDVRDQFLGDAPKPASSLIRVAGLFRPDLLVEVDAVVALP